MGPAITKPSGYDEFYARGGWIYRLWYEKRFIKRRILRPLGLEKGLAMLEVGCGMGYQSHVLAKLGFRVTAIDLSEVGIQYAQAHFSGPTFRRVDAAELPRSFPANTFDVIYVRGMSWYHYELNTTNRWGVDVPGRTRELFGLLKPLGLFILQIKTDFSGKRPANDVHDNTYDDYVRLFAPLGDVVRVSDYRGAVLGSQADAERSGRNVIIATRKR